MEFGRRVNSHELPFKDQPESEDMGRLGRKFSITALVDDKTVRDQGYFQTRDELIDFIENDDSPGTLILPTLGKRRVRPTGCSVSFNNQVGGMETLTLNFVEAGEETFPQPTVNTKETTFIQTDAMSQTVIEEGGDAVDVAPTLLDSTEGIADPDSFLDELQLIPNKFVNVIEIAIETGEQIQEEVTEFVRTLEDYSNQIRSTLQAPATFFEETKSMLTDLRNIWPDEALGDAFTAFNDIFNADVDEFGKVINVATPGREQQDINNQIVRDGYRNLILGQMSNITVSEAFMSTNEIQTRKETMLELFEIQIENAGVANDLLQRDSLVDLRAATLDHLDNEVGNLPDEIDIKIIDLTPVWVIANDLYADAIERGVEIVDSNAILNPNFVQGGSTIKVLTS